MRLFLLLIVLFVVLTPNIVKATFSQSLTVNSLNSNYKTLQTVTSSYCGFDHEVGIGHMWAHLVHFNALMHFC